MDGSKFAKQQALSSENALGKALSGFTGSTVKACEPKYFAFLHI